LAKASSLVCLDMRKSNFYPSKLDLRISGLVLLVFWCFSYSGTSVTSGTLLTRLGDLAIEKALRMKVILEEGHQMVLGQIPHQQKTLICMYDNSDVFHFLL
jgi:hypothetical protein